MNQAIHSLDQSFTPIRHQLRTGWDTVAKSTKYKILKKAKEAVNTLLETIAPGQGKKIQDALYNQTEKKLDDSDLLRCMNSALEQAVTQRDIHQLISIYCVKGSDGKYLYSKTEIQKMFPMIKVHDINMGRERANNNQQGNFSLNLAFQYSHLSSVV